MLLGLEYIIFAPAFVREILDAREGWEGKDAMPMKMQKLIIVLQIEAENRPHKNKPTRPPHPESRDLNP